MHDGKRDNKVARKPGVTRPAAATAAGKTMTNPKAAAVEKKAAASALREAPSKNTNKGGKQR
jgi:hypothetical protein